MSSCRSRVVASYCSLTPPKSDECNHETFRAKFAGNYADLAHTHSGIEKLRSGSGVNEHRTAEDGAWGVCPGFVESMINLPQTRPETPKMALNSIGWKILAIKSFGINGLQQMIKGAND
jgi:hypothetical protein